MPLSDPILSPPGAGDAASYGNQSHLRLLAAGPQTGGDYGVVLYNVKAGDEPPFHRHTREDESVFLLKGEITAYVGDQKIEVAEGSYAALPKGVPHGFRVKGAEATLLLTLSPAGAERFFVPAPGAGEANPTDFGLEMLGDLPD